MSTPALEPAAPTVRRVRLALAAVLLVSSSGLGVLGLTTAAAAAEGVAICHASNSDSNPYQRNAPDDGSKVLQAHGADTGPVWDPTLKRRGVQWGDIIPPIVPGLPDGLNWDTAGQEIHANGCNPVFADLRLVKTGTGGLQGGSGSYSLALSNVGNGTAVASSSSPLTVTDPLPAGVTATGTTGSGWSCSPSTGASVTCTYPTSLAPGASAPLLTIAVAFSATAPASPSNTATASPALHEQVLGNNASTAVVAVAADLRPVANDDAHTATRGGTAGTVSVAGNDTAGNLPTTVTAVTGASGSTTTAGGTVTVSAGVITYTPPPATSSALTDSFGYTLTDADGDSDPAVVTVTLTPDASPTARDDVHAATRGGAAATVTVSGNDTAGDAPTAVSAVSATTGGGTVTLTDGVITYTPPPATSAATSDSFTYTLRDADGDTSQATVRVTLTADATPAAADDVHTTTRGAAAGTVSVLGNDALGNPTTTVTSVTAQSGSTTTAGGTVTVTGGVITYTPPPATSSAVSDSFGYTITDGDGDSSSARVTVVLRPDAAPDAGDDAHTATRGGAAGPVPVLGNDVLGDAPTTITSVTGVAGATTGSGGTVALVDGLVSYTPPPATSGALTDSFTYVLTDGDGDTSSATVRVVLTPDASPVAVGDTAAAVHGSGPRTVAVLGNDQLGDTPSSVTSVSGPTTAAGGTVTVVGGVVTYTPPPAGSTATTDSFTYVLTDADGDTSTARVDVALTAPLPPVAQDDAYTRTAGTASTDLPVLANDSDPDTPASGLSVVALLPLDGDVLSAALRLQATVAAPAGLFSLAGGVVSYVPPASVPATVVHEVRYRITDGFGTAVATIRVTVEPAAVVDPPPGPVNRPPVAAADTAAFDLGQPAGALPVRGNDTDPDGDVLTVISVDTTGTLGTVTLVDGVVTYLPPAAGATQETTDSFTYVVSDGRGGTATAPVTITLTDASVPDGEPTPTPPASPPASPDPVTPDGGGPVLSPVDTPGPSASVLPAAGATAPPRTVAQPAALPFTGLSADLLLGLGAGLSVLGLLLALTGRRRTEQVR